MVPAATIGNEKCGARGRHIDVRVERNRTGFYSVELPWRGFVSTCEASIRDALGLLPTRMKFFRTSSGDADLKKEAKELGLDTAQYLRTYLRIVKERD
jgi:hypothetical protein